MLGPTLATRGASTSSLAESLLKPDHGITLLLQRVLILPNRSVLNSSPALVMLFMNKAEGKMVVAPQPFTFPHRESIYYAACLAMG